jgi:outer membrane autotransporter protein
LWFAPFVESVRQHGKPQLHGYKEFFAGFNMAVDYQTQKLWMFTTGFSYASGNMHVPNGRTHARFNTYAGSLGASCTPGSWFFDGQISGLHNSVDAKRKMHFASSRTFTTVNREAKHTQNSNEVLGHVGASYVFKLKPSELDRVNIYPFANLDYIFIPQGSYKEHGAGSLNLKVKSKDYDLLRPEAGFGVGYKRCSEMIEVNLDLTASYVHEFRFVGKRTHSSFKPASSCIINVGGLNPENNLISPTAKLRIATPGGRFSWMLGYHGEYGAHFSMSAGEMEFRMVF